MILLFILVLGIYTSSEDDWNPDKTDAMEAIFMDWQQESVCTSLFNPACATDCSESLFTEYNGRTDIESSWEFYCRQAENDPVRFLECLKKLTDTSSDQSGNDKEKSIYCFENKIDNLIQEQKANFESFYLLPDTPCHEYYLACQDTAEERCAEKLQLLHDQIQLPFNTYYYNCQKKYFSVVGYYACFMYMGLFNHCLLEHEHTDLLDNLSICVRGQIFSGSIIPLTFTLMALLFTLF